jgi:hypothetical protein
MTSRDSSKPGVSGLNKARAERVHQGQAGSRPVEAAHYRKSSDSNKSVTHAADARPAQLFRSGEKSGR